MLTMDSSSAMNHSHLDAREVKDEIFKYKGQGISFSIRNLDGQR